ncbi:DNA glycosylase AlkZ-like family protein [Paenibacillus caui]|uniref:DNA glycosylase AlkZ-like family protein n=1 Tax=Paenibacillus caui TaxID=2873927 RepID=UPI001CA7DC22|nr:crosslink repair DNA glycosylase YcaQ family protein [Paenibacillus caui]
MQPWTEEAVLAERMSRQGLARPLDDEEDEEAYLDLFKRLQPVAPVHFTRPGDPPKLVHRLPKGGAALASALREQQRIIKGRFNGGRIAYVLQEDLRLYATAFRKKLTKEAPIHRHILDLIQSSGGLSKEQLKEELPYPAGEITKALQGLHEAFLVYELQTDEDWDTGWLDFAEEWFELSDHPEEKAEALGQVVLQFINSMVFATEGQIKSWAGISAKAVRDTVRELAGSGRIAEVEMEAWGRGFMASLDLEGAPSETAQVEPSVFMLDKSDFLVRANLDELKKKYAGEEVLQYLLIDGRFQGAVTGHWRIGPYDVDDILVDLDEAAAWARQGEIIAAVRAIYTPEHHSILKFQGRPL